MTSAQNVFCSLSRGAHLERLRALLAARLDTFDCLNELVQIFWGLPSEVLIEIVARTIAEVLACLHGDAEVIQRLERMLAELLPLAGIPGEEELAGNDVAEAWPEGLADPVLQAVANSIERLCDAVDDRGFSEGVALLSARAVHSLLFAVAGTAVERHAPEARWARWRARQAPVQRDQAAPRITDPRSLHPSEVPHVDEAIRRFFLRLLERIEAEGGPEPDEPLAPAPHQWRHLGRAVGRCCGSLMRHERALSIPRPAAVHRLLLERAVRLECWERTCREHLRFALRGAPSSLTMGLGAAMVRRAYPHFPALHSNEIEQALRCIEAQGLAEDARPLSFALCDEVTSTPEPPFEEPDARSFYWSVSSLIVAAYYVGDPGLREELVASAVDNSIRALAQARLALENPELWQYQLAQNPVLRCGDPWRAARAMEFLFELPPSEVEEKELRAGWALVIERLGARR